MNHELVPMTEPLAVTRLSLERQDFLECQRALFGKEATLLYTIVAVCCTCVTCVYAIAGYAGVGNANQTKMLLVVLLCLLLASVFYFGIPKWLAEFRYRQYMTTNTTPKSNVFYPDRFEVLIDGAIAGVYPYTLMRRVIKSENLFIMVISNMLYLPIRYSNISEESWRLIEKYITKAMDSPLRKPKEHMSK